MKRSLHHDRHQNIQRRFVSPRRAREQLQELAYLQSAKLVTPCRLFMVLIGSVVMVMMLSLSIGSEQIIYAEDVSEVEANLTNTPYHMDYKKMQEMREEMMLHYGYSATASRVEKRSRLSLQEFWDLYDGKWPVIVTDVVPNWQAYKNWSKDMFYKKYGSDRIILKAVEGVLKDGVAHVREMKTFISLLEHPAGPSSWTYMEDEVFLLLRPELKDDIGDNYIIEENFFNLFPFEVRPWDSMMLWGTKYSRSTLHMDPYNWTAVNAVIWGRKKWKSLKNCSLNWKQCSSWLDSTDVQADRGLHRSQSEVDAFDTDYWKFPKFRKTECIEVEQTSGEMLIIPSGWFHQAYNDEETLAISMEMMNRNNYLVVLEEIIRGKSLSRKKIPAHFHTLLPPDQVKLFMSLLPQKILAKGKQVTHNLVNMLDEVRNNTADLQQPFTVSD